MEPESSSNVKSFSVGLYTLHYKFLCVEVVICVTLVNRHADRQLLTGYTTAQPD